ncbi:SusC/RagA family TonB-linked outer membrane protein [Sphingobacterium bovistauri]|uniref:SusC/RagA family TonB-linked outer membrane protein n=1 Tax=Sphingobacterium bovistauri TaxID=2781959 RepID=A0ABS7Z684_9SPHI|nr:SusC/RagA family TonB-linked outer membrane protein [Sphingobacterium bovistauri]MCA5005708.1 SusC/RagA family TonB-linked outer membrane protein [Sphingobacterium bovistauri]
MKRRLLLTFFGVAVYASCLMAQQKSISGKVINPSGEAMGNVTVVVQGSNRTVKTNSDGTFTIQASPGEKLVFRAVGSSEFVQVVGSQNTYSISLTNSQEELQEVIVTAMGIKQQARSISFAVQNVSSKDISESNQPNLVNAIQGKVAGVQITNSGGAPGASANIMIRGGSSLSGNNQPLFVIDGIPVDNTTPVSQGGLSAGSAPASNRGIDINPEDIASMTVLKGPAAAALYGIRAASGAIVITTKTGTSGRGGVSYGNTFSFDQVNRLPELQSKFKQGLLGAFDDKSYLSWGPEFSSSDMIYDNLGDFFQSGFAQSHDLTASGGTEKTSFYTSASIFDQGGIAKNTDFGRKSFRLNADHKVFDNLKIGGNMNYVNTDRTYFPQGSANGVMGAIYWPRNVDMKDYLTPAGTQKILSENSTGAIDNPYWTINKKPITNKVNRVIAIGDISYDPFSWMNLTYRLGTDYYTENFQSLTTPTSQTNINGYLAESTANNQITTSTFLANFRKSLSDFNFNLTLGHNVEATFRQTTTATARNFIDPDFVGINNSLAANRTVSKSLSRRRIIGAFGDLNMDWKNMVFLNIRGRNDWSSTLPKSNNSFFYPSVSASTVVTDLLKELNVVESTGVLSYAKIRGAWAQVGKDAPTHVLQTTLGTYINDFTINPRGFITNINDYYGNPNLKPEFTNSYEVGADVRFFNNRLNLDVTWYKTKSDDQILGTRTPPSSGSFLAYLNGGSIQNKGWEAIVNIQPIKKQNFSWNFDVNFSTNKSKVLSLPGSLDRVELSDAWVVDDAAQGAAYLNGSLFGINGRSWKKNDQGQYLLDNNGRPQISSVLSQVGDRNPDWIGGITNNFKYKDFGLSFMWDFRQGGDVFNATAVTLVKSGLSPFTLDRGTTVIPGIIESTGVENNKAINLDQDYYQTLYAANATNFVEDGSWVRLRYVSLTYAAPQSLVNQLKLKNLQFTLTGRNLLLFSNYSGVDPEVSGSGAGVGGSGSFGFDNLGLPATRGFDFGFKFSF